MEITDECGTLKMCRIEGKAVESLIKHTVIEHFKFNKLIDFEVFFYEKQRLMNLLLSTKTYEIKSNGNL